MRRLLGTVLTITLGLGLAVGPAPTSVGVPPDPLRGTRTVAVGGSDLMILRPGCRETYRAGVRFDAVAGEEYWTTINAEDGTGRDIDGGIREGVVAEDGPVTVKVPLLLCGAVHDAGVGKIKVGLIVGGTSVDLRRRVLIKYDDKVSLRKASLHGDRTTLRGSWTRGKGFPRGLTTYVRKSVHIGLYFKAAHGSRWRKVGRTGIESDGSWSARVRVGRDGRWQARVAGSKRLLPARSQVVRAR